MSDSQTPLFETTTSKKTSAPAGAMATLSELAHGQEADFFALLTTKEELTTKDGKPYFRVSFRDAGREVNFPIWGDSPWATACRDGWNTGDFFKVRAQYRETNYGPQLEIRKIRLVSEEDRAEGFDPAMCLPASRFDRQEMFDSMVELATDSIDEQPLSDFVLAILKKYRETLLTQIQSPRACRRLSRTCAQRVTNLCLFGRQIRRDVSRHAAATA